LDTVETTHERDETHQSVNDKLNTISAKLDSVADDQATGISQSSHQTLEEAEELIKDATATAAEYEFDTLTGQLAEEKERYTRIKEQIEKDTPPTTVHSPPRQSLTYEDIKKGDPIGSGGNADVYRATATKDTDEITLAIKEPRMSGTIDTETIDQLINEAKTWQQLDDHDHIVSVINYGSAPLPWIAMEYMDGGNLSERTGELPFEQTLWTAQVMTRGIRYAHKRGVAHLDLKPSNILFRSVEDAWDVPKIADWGLSKHLLEHSQSVEGMSPRYAAPEQLDPEQFGETDTVTDVYQLGTLLYELFTGEPPFDGQTYEVMNKIQSATPTPPSERADLPEAIDDILLTALATERDDRYDDVLYIRDALQDLWKEYN
jgi:serine/threonine protein kinase